jgi:hypothetical protein
LQGNFVCLGLALLIVIAEWRLAAKALVSCFRATVTKIGDG